MLVAGPSLAQITLTASDAQARLGTRLGQQQFRAVTPSALQPLVGQAGGPQVYDWTPFAFEAVAQGVVEQGSLNPLPSDVPLAETFAQRGATLYDRVVLDPFGAGGAVEDSTVWVFSRVTSSAVERAGAAALTDRDIDFDGDTPDTLQIRYDPFQLELALPATFGDTWERTSELTVGPAPSTEITVESEVDGYGTLVTPAGRAEVLRVRQEETQASPGGGFTSTTYEFLSKDGRLFASLTVDGGTVTEATYTVLSEAGATVEVPANTTPDVTPGGLGLGLTFVQGSATAGALDVFRYDTAPVNETFSGTATSDDGTTISPDVVAEDRYFEVRNDGLTDFATLVCLEFGPTPGVTEPSKLVVLTRATANDPWTPLNTTVTGTAACAQTTRFSQFAIGSSTQFNPLPVTLAAFEVQGDGTDAVLAWTTASETNNARFEVQHRASGAWTQVGVVPGSGTTTEARRYQYRMQNLAPGTHRFRLRQVDVDGTAHLGPERTLVIQAEAPLVLSPISPNPVHGQALIRVQVGAAQSVTVLVYDALGRRVRSVHDGPLAGQQQHQLTVDTAGLPSGLYFVRARAASGHVQTRPMTVVR